MAGRLFTALGRENISIMMIAQDSNEINITVAVETPDFETAVNIQPEGAGVVHNHTAGFLRPGHPPLRHVIFAGAEDIVHTLEGIRGQFLHDQAVNDLAFGPGAGQQLQTPDFETAVKAIYDEFVTKEDLQG